MDEDKGTCKTNVRPRDLDKVEDMFGRNEEKRKKERKGKEEKWTRERTRAKRKDKEDIGKRIEQEKDEKGKTKVRNDCLVPVIW